LGRRDHSGAKRVHGEGYSIIQDYDKYDGAVVLDGTAIF